MLQNITYQFNVKCKEVFDDKQGWHQRHEKGSEPQQDLSVDQIQHILRDIKLLPTDLLSHLPIHVVNE